MKAIKLTIALVALASLAYLIYSWILAIQVSTSPTVWVQH